MIICDYYRQYRAERLVIGLGYFDSVHMGHKHLIDEVKSMASRLSAHSAIFTFSGNPFTAIGKDTKNIFPFDERVRRLDNLGVEVVISAGDRTDFFAMSGEEFLDKLTDNFNIIGVVSGTDYTYGRAASGNVESLHDYAKAHNLAISTVDLVKISGRKIASRDIRTLLLEGNISAVNELLTEPYSISGKVRLGRRDGGKIGFPTANIDIQDGTLIAKNGVYTSIAIVDGVRYKAVTNIGGHPTFNDNSKNIESYIIDFDGDIYGKEITIIPVRWLRGVMKFDSVETLRETIENDKNTTIREIIL